MYLWSHSKKEEILEVICTFYQACNDTLFLLFQFFGKKSLCYEDILALLVILGLYQLFM